MKNLDLNKIGVHEMSTIEMQETDGGFIWLLILAGAVVLGATSCQTNTPPTIVIGSNNEVVINSNQSADSTLNGNTVRASINIEPAIKNRTLY